MRTLQQRLVEWVSDFDSPAKLPKKEIDELLALPAVKSIKRALSKYLKVKRKVEEETAIWNYRENDALREIKRGSRTIALQNYSREENLVFEVGNVVPGGIIIGCYHGVLNRGSDTRADREILVQGAFNLDRLSKNSLSPLEEITKGDTDKDIALIICPFCGTIYLKVVSNRLIDDRCFSCHVNTIHCDNNIKRAKAQLKVKAYRDYCRIMAVLKYGKIKLYDKKLLNFNNFEEVHSEAYKQMGNKAVADAQTIDRMILSLSAPILVADNIKFSGSSTDKKYTDSLFENLIRNASEYYITVDIGNLLNKFGCRCNLLSLLQIGKAFKNTAIKKENKIIAYMIRKEHLNEHIVKPEYIRYIVQLANAEKYVSNTAYCAIGQPYANNKQGSGVENPFGFTDAGLIARMTKNSSEATYTAALSLCTSVNPTDLQALIDITDNQEAFEHKHKSDISKVQHLRNIFIKEYTSITNTGTDLVSRKEQEDKFLEKWNKKVEFEATEAEVNARMLASENTELEAEPEVATEPEVKAKPEQKATVPKQSLSVNTEETTENTSTVDGINTDAKEPVSEQSTEDVFRYKPTNTIDNIDTFINGVENFSNVLKTLAAENRLLRKEVIHSAVDLVLAGRAPLGCLSRILKFSDEDKKYYAECLISAIDDVVQYHCVSNVWVNNVIEAIHQAIINIVLVGHSEMIIDSMRTEIAEMVFNDDALKFHMSMYSKKWLKENTGSDSIDITDLIALYNTSDGLVDIAE